MADIQSSLRRLQESIRGLSDASALVGAVDVSVPSQKGGEGCDHRVTSAGDDVAGRTSSYRSRPASSTSTFKGHSADECRQNEPYRYHGDDEDSRSSHSGGLAKQVAKSFLSSIPGDVRHSAEMRAARELEDLRMEKESLQVMKKQLAAVHQLRIDLQRKDSVIQSLQLKVQEGESARDREGRLEAHCHLLEKRCSYLEATNGEYAERFGALDQESRSRIDGLKREKEELKQQLRDSESELKSERRRFEAAAAAHRGELTVALVEAADARDLAADLKGSLEEFSAQANRRHGRWAEMEKLLTNQLEDTRASLARAERRAVATADIRRRDAEAAAAAATALAAHLNMVCGGGSPSDGGGGVVGGDERRSAPEGSSGCGEEGWRALEAGQGSTETFVELSGRWCGNEILALTWVEVSKALEALDAAQVGRRTAVCTLRDSKRQATRQQEEINTATRDLANLREELSRLRGVEARLDSTAVQLEAAREQSRRQQVSLDAAWTQLSSVGAIAISPPFSSSGGRGGGTNATSSSIDDAISASNIDSGRASARVEFEGMRGIGSGVAVEVPAGRLEDAKLAEIPEGIRRLIKEWSERRNGLEALTRRLREEGARRDEERARLEALAEAAKQEAGARGEELARMMVEFETRAACAEAGIEEKIAKVRADAVADANLRVSAATEEAARKVAAVTTDAARKVAEAVDTADRKASEAAAAAGQRVSSAVEVAAKKEEEADRRVSAAEEALAAAKDGEQAAVALSQVALESRRSAEAALKVLGRFVGPLHRLCLELREQKRFLSRSYRRDAPLQAELFAVAAAVSGKDYWCLLSRNAAFTNPGGDSNRKAPARQTRTSSDCGGGDRRYYAGCGWDAQHDKDDALAARVPPSLRAVVVAVVAANRFGAFARASSAARRDFDDWVGEGPAGGAEAASRGLVEGTGKHRHHRREQRLGRGGIGGEADARYLARAGGMRSLPVLPPWCCGARGRGLHLPAAGELEGMPDGKALETVLGRLLVFGWFFSDGRGRSLMAAEAADGRSSGTGGGGVLNIEALWGGGGPRAGDLLYHLIRGRKDHMTRVKERGLALDPRPPSSEWARAAGGDEESLASLGFPLRRRANSIFINSGGNGTGGGEGYPAGGDGWRVKLGRTVRLELERSLWLGEGPGQPGSLHLREIRKALAALARELNLSEGKRLEMERALRAAGGGVGIAELEKSADVLRCRVELLEAEASAKPAVGVEAFAALREEMKAATAAGMRLREQVEHLEGAVSTAKRAAAEASAASERAKAERDEAEERVGRLDASKQEIAREVEQLKAFATRANIERNECLERERAAAREKAADETLNPIAATAADIAYHDHGVPQTPVAPTLPTTRGRSDADGLPQAGVLSQTQQAHRMQSEQQQEHQQMQHRLAQTQEELRRCRKEEERSRSRCVQLEARLVEARSCLEEQKGITSSMRRAAARAHEDAEAARKEVKHAETRMCRQESECRRQVSLLEARLLEASVKNSRRRDLLQLQAFAQEDLVNALKDPVLSSTCGETVVVDLSDDGLLAEEPPRSAVAFNESLRR